MSERKRKRPAFRTGRFENDQLGGKISSKKYPPAKPSASALRAARDAFAPIEPRPTLHLPAFKPKEGE